ncbi:Flp pilus assembly protein TadG [Nocardioides aromaticivorans]|uniref:Flp pilus assembly protein TadG n=1 Tax=Nocardioides aromaticivorans TaxID=200618 RepID=A0A7Y9ZIY4_9ACTN|nr:TadE/TadG family type IV pilus assembly protein [Nocardioides aromaticivorans]NYI46309.1 Flp pilus assembly protein TadG [Nocardioides aromaticivorans]
MDFTLVSVVLVPIVLGIVQVALVLHVRATLAAAASEGARLAATAGSSPGEGVARTRSQIADAVGSRYAHDVEVRRVSVDGAPAIEVIVHAEVPALGLGGPAVQLTVSGRAVQEDPR